MCKESLKCISTNSMNGGERCGGVGQIEEDSKIMQKGQKQGRGQKTTEEK